MDAAAETPAVNGYGAHPPMRGLGRYYELDVRLAGEPDGDTGYLMNIKEIDQCVRGCAVPIIAGACAAGSGESAGTVLSRVVGAIGDRFGVTLRSVGWRMTPYYEVEMSTADTRRVVLRQSFDFCAAHRLHVDLLTDAENRDVFGKCNNPNAHGHNYRVDTEISVDIDGAANPNELIERVVDRVIIEAFDHKNLNMDTESFASGSGVNPSVENMARVFYELLSPAIGAEVESGNLEAITVWETDRTSCRYPA